MTEISQDKKLVQKYKQTNKALRQQLLKLNQQVDKLLIKKSNTVGLKKLPKLINKTNQTQVIQSSVNNLKQRLELLERDKIKYKQKAEINYHQELKNLQQQLEQKKNEQQQLRRGLRTYQRQQRIQFAKNTEIKVDEVVLDQIERLNDQIARVRKVQKQLRRALNEQEVFENRKINNLVERQQQNRQLTMINKPVEIKLQATSNSGQDYMWIKLKKQFLELKQSKQQQQMLLYEQNDSTRKQIRQLEQKIKERKAKLEIVKSISVKKDQKNYSTLEKVYQEPKFRYRDKNNSIQYPRTNRDVQI